MNLPRLARPAIVLSVLVFLPLVFGSMQMYPGGTSWDHASVGHDFWKNYLCDLLRPTALDGVPNPLGSALAKTATLMLACGLFSFFYVVGREFPSLPRLGRAVAVLGALSSCAVPGVVFVSGDRYGIFHGVAVIVAAIPGLSAALLAVVGLALGEDRPKRGAFVGAATLAVALVDFALYVPQVLSSAPGPIAVAVLERIALGLVLVWMCVVAALRPAGASDRGRERRGEASRDGGREVRAGA
ncbi:MAG TPA: hypothetical protein VIF62_35670 [Labilithrix sp.]